MNSVTEPADLVDDFYRPYVRGLGNLVILFATCEAALLEMITAYCSGKEIEAVQILKANDAKDQVIKLVRRSDLTGFDFDEILSAIDGFWHDKEIRNRLIHDQWYPNILESGVVNTRGLTRKKTPMVVFGEPNVSEIWELAARFREYASLFSYRAWAVEREEGPKSK